MSLEDMGVVRNDIWAERNGLPEYVCHKKVRAAKVVDLAPSGSEDIELKLEGLPSYTMHRTRYAACRPEVGGYLVFYADGYVSYSPAKAFEEGYTRMPLVVDEPMELSPELLAQGGKFVEFVPYVPIDKEQGE